MKSFNWLQIRTLAKLQPMSEEQPLNPNIESAKAHARDAADAAKAHLKDAVDASKEHLKQAADDLRAAAEVKARELVSLLEAQLIQASASERETDTCSEPAAKERPTCPTCQVPLLSRGKRTRQLQGPAGRAIDLKRTYATCPSCGTGFFPP